LERVIVHIVFLFLLSLIKLNFVRSFVYNKCNVVFQEFDTRLDNVLYNKWIKKTKVFESVVHLHAGKIQQKLVELIRFKETKIIKLS
jgi:hypothetical protein